MQSCSVQLWAKPLMSASTAEDTSHASPPAATVTIAGPLRPFLRMAGISQKASPEEILPLLAKNVFSRGYTGQGLSPRPTEFLILLERYLQQSRELEALADRYSVIRVASCEGSESLLQVLGYRLREGCTQNVILQVSDARRAFLTVDSGFPLTDLEVSLQSHKAFAYSYSASTLPVLFTENDWSGAVPEAKRSGGLVDELLREPALARLYWAMSRMDPKTRTLVFKSRGLARLVPLAPALDFYGSNICVESGRVVIPGGAPAEPVWKHLVGASPSDPVDFVNRILAKDNGWLVAYFDSLIRTEHNSSYFTDPGRIERFYKALRGQNPSPTSYRPVFRPDPGMLLLLSRLRLEPNGEPSIPGNIEVWERFIREQAQTSTTRRVNRRFGEIRSPEQLIECLFGLSRVEDEFGPVRTFLVLNALDARRTPASRLKPSTVNLLASKFERFGDQYLIFSEFPSLDDESLSGFINVASSLDRIRNQDLRGDAIGIFQSIVGLWQIMARQQEIPTAKLNDSCRRVTRPFQVIRSATELFDATNQSLQGLLEAATGSSAVSQEAIISLLAGPDQKSLQNQQVHQEIEAQIFSAMNSQRLVSLTTLITLGGGSPGAADGPDLKLLLDELKEFEMPRPIFHNSERAEWAAGIYNNRRIEQEMHVDLHELVTNGAPAGFKKARGQLTPFLRDTLVGLNYACDAPPGARVLYHNPLLVRSHDFIGESLIGAKNTWQKAVLVGAGSPAGGGARLVGSLAELPYVLAEIEGDFIVPENTQALIWREVVPTLLSDATVPRWWSVTANELHAVALYQRAGEELLSASVRDEKLRDTVMEILSAGMSTQSATRVRAALESGRISDLSSTVTPVQTFGLTAEFQRRFPSKNEHWGVAGKELLDLTSMTPSEVSSERLSRDFGVPHPVLAQSYALELLNPEPFPAFMGYASRSVAESWESGNLYWAKLADEKGYTPVMLNLIIPELTRRMVEKIFATEQEDWPALIRAMLETGEEFRHSKTATLPTRREMSMQ